MNMPKSETPVIKGAFATLYKDKILINTQDQVKMGLSVVSTKLTILKIDCTADALGEVIRTHLNLTEYGLPNPSEGRSYMDEFLRVAGFKTPKDSYHRCKNVDISEKNGIITLYPTLNKGRSFFEGIKDAVIKCDTNVSNEKLGELVRSGWELCEGGI